MTTNQERINKITKMTDMHDKMIDSCKDLINSRKRCLIGHNSLIELQGMYLKVETEWSEVKKSYIITNTGVVSSPAKASHFTPEAAKNLADNVYNGNKVRGVVVTWRKACDDVIRDQEKTASWFVHGSITGNWD